MSAGQATTVAVAAAFRRPIASSLPTQIALDHLQIGGGGGCGKAAAPRAARRTTRPRPATVLSRDSIRFVPALARRSSRRLWVVVAAILVAVPGSNLAAASITALAATRVRFWNRCVAVAASPVAPPKRVLDLW